MSSSESSPAWGSTRPMRSRSGSARGGSARGGLGGGGSGGGGRRGLGSGAGAPRRRRSGGAGGSGSARRAGSAAAPRAARAAARGLAAATGLGGSLTRKSSWRAPQDGQNRERTLMRSPQLAQYLVSVPAISAPSAALRALAARGGITSRRWTAGEPSVACSRPSGWRRASLPLLAAPAAAQSPPAGTPKILLAFDASGSMATDDGAGTPKIDAAQDAAVDLLGSLPPSTQVGLRVFGGTKPSRPIGPACRDSSLVLPIGPLDRAQAEQQIRSFKAKGRTPIAYALERAAEDLGTSGPRTIILVSDGKDTCQPPSPCQVAQRIAKGGVEMRIQAIGFNVDQSARRELQCIAAGGRRRLHRRRQRRRR